MSTNIINTKLNLDIGNFKSKMQDAKKSIEDLQKSIKDSTGKDFDLFGDTKVGKSIEDIKKKAKNLGETFKALPKPVQAIAGMTALGVVLKQVYEMGKKRFFSGLSEINNTIQPIIGNIKSLGNEIKTAFEALTGMGLNLGSFVGIAVNYEDAMARVQAITGTTGKEFEALKDKAREMGATTRYSATDASNAMIEMGQQGWDSSQILSGIGDVLNLATVGNIDLARSAEIVTNGLNAFNWEASKSGRYADILAQASVSSGTSVNQLGEALENVASTAGALNISVEDTATTIGLMGNKFIKSGKAGTSLKTFLANMVKPTKAMTDCISKYSLEGARQKIVNGDLISGYKEMAKVLEPYDKETRAAIATTLAGKEGMEGLVAIIGSGVDGIEKLEESIKKADGVAQHMAETFDATLKGALSNISSGIEEKVLQVFDKIKPTLTDAMNSVNEFFNIWNGFSDSNGKKASLEDALDYLEEKIKNAVPNITQAIVGMFSGIDNFINGGAFDSILEIGTSIVTGICDGINKAKENGTLDSAISGAITKICDWINTNGSAIEEAGKSILDSIKTGISKNADKLNNAVDTVFGIINTFLIKKQDILQTTGSIVGASFIKGMITGIAIEGVNTIGNAIFAVVNTAGSFIADFANVGISLATSLVNSFMGFIFDVGLWDLMKEKVMEFDTWLNEYRLKTPFGELELGGGTTKAEDSGFTYGKAEGEGRNRGLKESKTQTDTTASEIGQGISDNILNKLETMDSTQLKGLGDELRSLQTTTGEVATGIGTSFGKIREASRTSFMGVCNIARNQFVNMANIVNNQCQNARNNATRSFISMRNVIRTQVTEARTVVVSKMMSISAVVNTQSWKARDNATRAFMSLAAVIRTQMAKAYSSVQTYMSQISASTSKSLNLKVNVSRTVTTTQKTVAQKVGTQNYQMQSLNLMASRSLSGINSLATASYSAPVALSSANRSVSMSTNSSGPSKSNETLKIEMPVYLDSKQIGISTAEVVNGKIKTKTKRNNRRKGI